MHCQISLGLIAIPAGAIVLAIAAAAAAAQPQTTTFQVPRAVQPPGDSIKGIVIDHSPKSSRTYIGSPSIAILPGGQYVASHDFFGPGCSNDRSVVFGSSDRGASWAKLADIQGQWWSTLFAHREALYILGATREYGQIVIRRSTDGGRTWTTPTDAASGLLRAETQYHCAPMPVIVHDGRLWRGFERRDPPRGWGITFCAGMISTPVNADLLDAKSWTVSNFLPGDRTWLGGKFGGWLEGNAVVGRDGKMLDILRVETPGYPEKAAIVRVSGDGRTVSFDPQTGFIDFPGGAKKFTIRFDPKSDLYWTLTTLVPQQYQSARRPGATRNTLALACSKDLTQWTARKTLLQHADVDRHGFQYVDWLFEGDDIIAVCRTAYDDAEGGARDNHDANFLTFHRVENFRTATDVK